jgi:hypothetical protein
MRTLPVSCALVGPLLLLAVTAAGAADPAPPVAAGTVEPVSEDSVTVATVAAPWPVPSFASMGNDTLRSNLWVAQALLGSVVDEVRRELPPAPAVVLLVPGSTEAPANVLTDVATRRLQREGYLVHLDRVPADTELPVVEVRYRVTKLALQYPDSGKRLLLWRSWVARQMELAVQFTVIDREDGQVLLSRRLVRHYQDRLPHEYLTLVESSEYPAFTRATPQSRSWSRRLEEIVVLGTLAGLVAIYFTNVE